MDSWERFSETKLPTKEEFCNNLKMENITDADYKNAKTKMEKIFNKKI